MCSILPVFLKKSVINNGIKSATPLKILSFEEKLSGISFFSRVWHMGGKVLPKVEFFAWVLSLIFSFFGGRCWKKSLLNQDCWRPRDPRTYNLQRGEGYEQFRALAGSGRRRRPRGAWTFEYFRARQRRTGTGEGLDKEEEALGLCERRRRGRWTGAGQEGQALAGKAQERSGRRRFALGGKRRWRKQRRSKWNWFQPEERTSTASNSGLRTIGLRYVKLIET